MDLLALKTELTTDPAGIGYAAFLPDPLGEVERLLNERTLSASRPRFITARTILAECGAAGPGILDALEAAAAGNSAVKWAVKFLSQDSGIDVGHPNTQAMIDSLATGGALTTDQATALKNLAHQPVSRADVLGFGTVTVADIRAALGA